MKGIEIQKEEINYFFHCFHSKHKEIRQLIRINQSVARLPNQHTKIQMHLNTPVDTS